MKKKISLIVAAAMIFVIALSLVGCGSVYIGDEATTKKNMEKLVTALENKDREEMKALFAPNKIAEIEDIDESIDELLAYYEGEHISHTSMTGMSSASKQDNYICRYQQSANDIVTTAGTYSIATTWYTQDTVDSGNVGIWSFFILKKQDNPRTRYTYWGDGSDAPGIYVGLEHPTAVIYRLVDVIDNQDRDGIKALFAPNKILELEGFDESIDELIAYYNNVDNADVSNGRIVRDGKGKDVIYYKVAYDIFDNQLFVDGMQTTKYRIAVEWHVADDTSAGNIGLWSVYILKCEDIEELAEDYWGDGEFVPGIHVAMPRLLTDME